MAIHSINLAWKIPWKEGPGVLQCMGCWTQLSTHTHKHTGYCHEICQMVLLHCSEPFSVLTGQRKTQILFTEPTFTECRLSPTFTEPLIPPTSLIPTALPLLPPLQPHWPSRHFSNMCQVCPCSRVLVFAVLLPGLLLPTCSVLAPLSAVTKSCATWMILVVKFCSSWGSSEERLHTCSEQREDGWWPGPF